MVDFFIGYINCLQALPIRIRIQFLQGNIKGEDI
jgi:hypothetical protein